MKSLLMTFKQQTNLEEIHSLYNPFVVWTIPNILEA